MVPDNSVETKAELSVGRLIVRALVQFVFSFAIWSCLLFGVAGTIRWPRGWIHIGLWVVTLAINLLVLLRLNPDVIAQRTKRQKITKGFDMLLMGLLLPATLALPVVAALDAVRFEWCALPAWTIRPGVAAHAAGV